MLIVLKVVVYIAIALVALVASIIGLIYAHQFGQLLRFRASMRKLAKDDAQEDDPALDVPELKETLEEEQARRKALWKLFYRPGLSITKLHASSRLRDAQAFTESHWIEWEEWRGWQRLAIEGSEAIRQGAHEYARKEAERRLGGLPRSCLPLWLELYDAKRHPELKLQWAQHNLNGGATWAALRVLEELASHDDNVGNSALYELFNHYTYQGSRDKALAYAKRYLAPPKKNLHDVVRGTVRKFFSPELGELNEYGSYWGLNAPRSAKLQVKIHALDVKASESTWLDDPKAPLGQAALGEVLLEKTLDTWKVPLLREPVHFFKLPHLEGPVRIEVSAQLPASRTWSECMGDESMPVTKVHCRVQNCSLDAVLTLTENSVSTWVVDKKTKAPVANVPLTLMHRDAGGTKIETLESATDEDGLFTWKGKPAWQFGVLVERLNGQGRKEQLFVTNGSDVATSKAPEVQRRFYVMLARPLYRPGERVQGKLFARQKGHEGSSKKIAAKQTYQLEVFGPRGTKSATISCALSEFGSASFDFVLPADAALGRYIFKTVNVSPQPKIEGSFHVEEFVAPEFRAELRAKDELVWGKKYKLEFEASYFFGGPVANAEGTLEIKRSNWTHTVFDNAPLTKHFHAPKSLAPKQFKTDAQGKASIAISWNGPWDVLQRFDGCDFDFVATVRDASGKSCQATLHVSVGRAAVIVSAKPAKTLRVPGETLPLLLEWEPADSTDDAPRKVTLTCRKGTTQKTTVHELRRSDEIFDMPLELPAGRWQISAHVEGQRARTKYSFTLLGPALQQKSRELIVSNDPSDSQGTIRVALTGPTTYLSKELLVYNRGPRLFSKVLDRESPTTWVDLPFIPGTEEKVHFALWHFDARDERLRQEHAVARIDPLSIPNEAPIALELAFPSAVVRPGAETSIEAKLSETQQKPSELTVTVIDEALFSLVAPPKSPLAFFEDSPPRPQSFPAWSAASAHAQQGRIVYSHVPRVDYLQHSVVAGGLPPPAPMIAGVGDMPAASYAMPVPMAPAARKSASPMRAAAAIAAAPVALVGAGAGLVAEAVMRKRQEAPGGLEEDAGAAMPQNAPVQLRSDFSSEAAWIPHARFGRNGSLTLPIKLPDSLTTWKASALLVSLAHDHLLEAHARVRTQKPLMVRLQAPRFFQERDVVALRAMLDSRSEQTLSVEASLQAGSITLPANARSSRSLEPNGQARIDVELAVPAYEEGDVVVRAEVIATNADDVSDAEERKVPYRPYGVLLRKTLSGVLAEEPVSTSFELPEERKKEFTKLSVQLDRGPMDAVLGALDYLREYPYGCVEQTCSRLLPHLLWERISSREEAGTGAYRSFHGKLSDDVVQETIRRIVGMQNADGGFGWWPGGHSDLWMTAYVVFSFSMASQPDSDSLQKARAYLTKEQLRRNHSDDADVFAAFAIAWTGGRVGERVIEVLSSRWENLSLTERAKFCWVLAAEGDSRAQEHADEVRKALVGPAKRFLKKVARDDESDLQWYHPGSTEAIAFYVLALLREGKTDDETLEVLVAFLLQHRKGKRWHNTRDTALAVLAVLSYEERMRGMGHERTVDVRINAESKQKAKLERLGEKPISMQFRDEDLRTGENELSFVLDEKPAGAPIAHRHFSAVLEYYTQESEIAASGEGMEVERTYWLLDEKKEPKRQLRNGDSIEIGQRLRVMLKVKAAKPRAYLLLEDMKLAGCEPVAKKSGRDVCKGQCAHVELRADRTAIFFDTLGTDRHEVSYDIEAALPGRFTAMPARIETMYESRCHATSASFALRVEEGNA